MTTDPKEVLEKYKWIPEYNAESGNRTIEAELYAALKSVLAERQAWEETAAQFIRNSDFYRGLLGEIAKHLGKEVYVSDDGSVQDEPLMLKIPEMVKSALADRQKFTRKVPCPDFDSRLCSSVGRTYVNGKESPLYIDCKNGKNCHGTGSISTPVDPGEVLMDVLHSWHEHEACALDESGLCAELRGLLDGIEVSHD